MGEWLKPAVLKTVSGVTRSGVRIPLPPPETRSSRQINLPIRNISPSGNPLPSGLLEGNFAQLGNQLIGVAITCVLAVVGTVAILKLVDMLVGLRVSSDQEIQGLDLSQHGEEGYAWEISA